MSLSLAEVSRPSILESNDVIFRSKMQRGNGVIHDSLLCTVEKKRKCLVVIGEHEGFHHTFLSTYRL